MSPTHDEPTACQQTSLSEEEEREPPTLVPEPEQSPPADEPTERVTHREQEISILLGRGLIDPQIAQELSISERTVENHITKILEKQWFSSRARIATWVAQRQRSPSGVPW